MTTTAALPHVLVARMDNAGDVLVSGPAVRAVADKARVTFLCGPAGEQVARLLPGVDSVLVHSAAWIEADPPPIDRTHTMDLVDCLAASAIDQAVILTSFHQSPLPLALLLRMAGVPVIAAISPDYPGSLLDIRHAVADDIHEVQRALSLVRTLGYRLPAGDDGGLALRLAGRDLSQPFVPPPYIVLHPGASVPARAWSPKRMAELAGALCARGWRVVITGGADEVALTAEVSSLAGRPEAIVDLGGRTDMAGLAKVLSRANVVVAGNTGPAHLAAAVRTPVVSIYAPTVPAERWRPWGVPHVLLGDQDIGCAGCRARICPVHGHPCIDTIEVESVVAAVDALAPRPAGVPG